MNNLNNQNQYGYYGKTYSSNNGDERIAGGFIFPFLLGGVTGAAIAPAFYNNNRPVYYYQPYPMPYYPYYPRRFF